MKAAALFPGQGAQYVGMGKDLYRDYPEAREVFDRADETLGWPLRQVCFAGPEEKLNSTDVSQPALLTTSIAALQAGWKRGLDKVNWRYAAGLSLGEYTALVFADALDFEAALKLVYKRGQFMQEASIANPGGMVSVLGLGPEQVKDICQQAVSIGIVVAANFNCPGQVVISGQKRALTRVCELARRQGARRLIELQVAGAFHSPLMQPAADKLRSVLADVEIRTPRIPVIANVSSVPTTSPGEIRKQLVQQTTSSVLWQQSLEYMLAKGINEFYEIGPGKVLAGLLRRTDRKASVHSIGGSEAIAALPDPASLSRSKGWISWR